MMSAAELKILFVADVVGHPGRDAVKALLPELKKELHPNLVIVNGENAAGGFGLTAKIVAELRGAGADIITTGNHVFAQKEFVGELPNHIPTADARVLPGGTAYVTDVGMVGPRDGCIGMDRDVVVQRFLTGVPNRFVVASGPVTFNSVLVTINSSTGRSTSIQRVDREHI